MQSITHTQVQELVLRLPDAKLPVAYNFLVGLANSRTETPPHQELQSRQSRPTIAELLSKLREIQKTETAEIELPTRQDRPVALIETADELSL